MITNICHFTIGLIEERSDSLNAMSRCRTIGLKHRSNMKILVEGSKYPGKVTFGYSNPQKRCNPQSAVSKLFAISVENGENKKAFKSNDLKALSLFVIPIGFEPMALILEG